MLDRWKNYEAWVEYGPQPANPALPEGTPGNYPGKWLGFFWTRQAAQQTARKESFVLGEPEPQRAVVARMPRKGMYFKTVVSEWTVTPE